MGDLRELAYGVLFYLSVIAGAFVGFMLVMPDAVSADRNARMVEVVMVAAFGGVAGGWAWLKFKYSRLTPPA